MPARPSHGAPTVRVGRHAEGPAPAREQVTGPSRRAACRNRTDDLFITSSSSTPFWAAFMLRVPAMWCMLAWLLRAVGGTSGARSGKMPTPRACASNIARPLEKAPRRRRSTHSVERVVVAKWQSRWAVVLHGTEPERRRLGPTSSRRLCLGDGSPRRPREVSPTGRAPPCIRLKRGAVGCARTARQRRPQRGAPAAGPRAFLCRRRSLSQYRKSSRPRPRCSSVLGEHRRGTEAGIGTGWDVDGRVAGGRGAGGAGAVFLGVLAAGLGVSRPSVPQVLVGGGGGRVGDAPRTSTVRGGDRR